MLTHLRKKNPCLKTVQRSMASQVSVSRVNFRQIAFAKLRDSAFAPCYATQLSAGLDLRAECGIVIPPRGQALVPTGITFQIPVGHYGRLASRSGLANSHRVHIGAGVIDPDYTGEIQVLLQNHGTQPFEVTRGARIAQIIFEQISLFQPVQRPLSFFGHTERGNRGFGSSDQYLGETSASSVLPAPASHRVPLLPDPNPALHSDMIQQWASYCSRPFHY